MAQTPIVNPESLVADIARVLSINPGLKDREYTAAVKALIYKKYCVDLGRRVRCTHPEGDSTEFMLDLCAYSGQQIELAMESEWLITDAEIYKDFEKLLHIKAVVKLMVCPLLADVPRTPIRWTS